MSRRVLITGATSGLGREMALQLAREGCRLALSGRRRERLLSVCRDARSAGAPEVLELLGSVGDAAQVAAHYAQIKRRWGGLDWAILNAGVGDSKDARQFSAQNYRWTFECNVFGAAQWLEALLPDMIAARSGVVAGIASLAAYRGLPLSGAYSASKAALVTLLESTRVDLRGSGVDVVTVSPGFVKSELTDRNPPGSMPFLLSTEDGAARIIAGIKRRKRLVHFPWQLSLPVLYGLRHLPDALYDRLAARLRRSKRPDPKAPR
ncbi:MAG: SDR family NAD(P)-dependent oxidoreductase [Elusimicrobia bacterium]|nr:SDR family NAD(P)-dependent oxidoreductase [Elusimicrobiota bacterium]MDE2236733.1 SDR family NAD(P)-dependent oxidoreductase [Elusimicrobiota bacterium]MDE2426794.1 SDR family NAD(P)-dependent oxidoreductase [Elusimicrobiota bacterium]